jgi:hypothetical protein
MRINRNARPTRLTASDHARLRKPLAPPTRTDDLITAALCFMGRAFVFVCDNALLIGFGIAYLLAVAFFFPSI